MRYNKLLYIVGIAITLCTTETVYSQTTVQEDKIVVKMNELSQRGDSLYIDMSVTNESEKISSRRSIEFTPILLSDTHSKELPKIQMKGRSNYRNYCRSLLLMNKREREVHEQVAPYAVLKSVKKGTPIVNYRLAIPYDSWMAAARFELQKDDCGCGKSTPMNSWVLANQVDLENEPYEVTPHLAYIQPVVETVKNRELQSEVFLDFAVGQAKIDTAFSKNTLELNKIHQMFEKIQTDKDVDVKGIQIAGYASPEDSWVLNQRLSQNRAYALQNYMQQRYNTPKNLYTIDFGGEDWAGLVTLIQNSDMQYKQEVLDIIKDVNTLNGRETKLMALKGGAPYKYMFQQMFPQLRQVICKISYSVCPFKVNRAKQLFNSKPQYLSLNEMFQVANTYEKGSPEFNNAFDVAVSIFPDDETANLNAAAAALSRKDLLAAEKYLSRVKSRIRIPEHDNSQGVFWMLKGDYEKAKGYFNAALQAGVESARANIEELRKKRIDIEKNNN